MHLLVHLITKKKLRLGNGLPRFAQLFRDARPEKRRPNLAGHHSENVPHGQQGQVNSSPVSDAVDRTLHLDQTTTSLALWTLASRAVKHLPLKRVLAKALIATCRFYERAAGMS